MSLSSGDQTLPKFTFRHIEDKVFPFIQDKEVQEYFLKWGLKDYLTAQLFVFDQPFQPYEHKTLLNDFMSDPSIYFNLKIHTSESWTTLGQKAASVNYDFVPCTVLSLEFFDRLKENRLVHESGHISKCFDDFFEDFIISDELRKMLLIEESENYELFSESEKEEFLFRLFKHICLGGRICQFEDEINPYFNVIKKMYRDLVSVVKHSETKELKIISCIYKITASDKDGSLIYPADEPHEQTFAYLFVDPCKKTITVLYSRFA